MKPTAGPTDPTSAQLGRRLAVPAIVLFCIYAAMVVGAILPLRLLDPVWQLAFAGTLINNAPLALVGLAGLHLAAHLEPGDPVLARRRSAAARWATLAAAGFLLLIPLQLTAVWHTFQARESVQNRQMVIADRRIAAVRRAITASPTVEQLQAELARLNLGTLAVRGNPSDRSLTQVRATLLRSLEGSRSTLEDQFRTSGKAMIWNLVQQGLQVSVTSMALAIGFAAMAQGRRKHSTLLEEWQRRRLRFRLPWPSLRSPADARTLWKQQ